MTGARMLSNADIARVFAQVADLMEIKGADPFRINSYRRVARAIGDYAGQVHELAAQGRLGELTGVGKASTEKIQELLVSGKLRLREELVQEVPEALLDLLDIPSLGPKKVAVLWKERGITSLGDLRSAIAAGKLADLKGFGLKTVDAIRQGLEFLERSAGRVRLSTAWIVAEGIRTALLTLPGVQRVEYAGSLRRGKETVGDLDLLCIADEGARIVEHFANLPGVLSVSAKGGTKGSITFEYRSGRTVQVDLRVVPAASFGAAWQYFTGSKEHNVRLRERAAKRGWSLNEYGLTDGEQVLAAATEDEIYRALDLPLIPPELREDRGEFELKQSPADLLTLADIRGDLHMHTTASDGRASIAEMVAAAKARGYQYVCITDHSQSSVIANGLKPDRLREHIRSVRALGETTRGITVWVGAEVDILSEGRLDYPDELLAELDWVVASVHAGMSHDVETNTQRTLGAIRSRYVNLIAHPTGRLLNQRAAMPLDVEAVAREAARTGTALEINSSGKRLDLKDQHARLARDLGATICIDTDAHETAELELMRFGVCTARRADLRKDDVLNTRPAAQIRKFVEAKRGR